MAPGASPLSPTPAPLGSDIVAATAPPASDAGFLALLVEDQGDVPRPFPGTGPKAEPTNEGAGEIKAPLLPRPVSFPRFNVQPDEGTAAPEFAATPTGTGTSARPAPITTTSDAFSGAMDAQGPVAAGAEAASQDLSRATSGFVDPPPARVARAPLGEGQIGTSETLPPAIFAQRPSADAYSAPVPTASVSGAAPLALPTGATNAMTPAQGADTLPDRLPPAAASGVPPLVQSAPPANAPPQGASQLAPQLPGEEGGRTGISGTASNEPTTIELSKAPGLTPPARARAAEQPPGSKMLPAVFAADSRPSPETPTEGAFRNLEPLAARGIRSVGRPAATILPDRRPAGILTGAEVAAKQPPKAYEISSGAASRPTSSVPNAPPEPIPAPATVPAPTDERRLPPPAQVKSPAPMPKKAVSAPPNPTSFQAPPPVAPSTTPPQHPVEAANQRIANSASKPGAATPPNSPTVADPPDISTPRQFPTTGVARDSADPIRPLAPDPDGTPPGIGDLPPLSGAPLREVTGLSTTSAPAATAALARAEQITAQITGQMASLSNIADRAVPLEITLDPPELGQLRISVARGDDGMVLNVTIDRPETLDLMRRYAGLLTQEFQRQGLENTGFSFSGRDRDPSGSAHADPNGSGQAPNESGPGEQVAITANHLEATGLDIRI